MTYRISQQFFFFFWFSNIIVSPICRQSLLIETVHAFYWRCQVSWLILVQKMESMIWLQILAETVVYVGSLCTSILRKGMNPLLLVLSQLSTVSTKFSSLACHNSSLWSLPFTQRFFPDIGTICNLIGSVSTNIRKE